MFRATWPTTETAHQPASAAPFGTQARSPHVARFWRVLWTFGGVACRTRKSGKNPNSSLPHKTASSGAARQNSGASERVRPSRPTTCLANDGAQQPARTWKFCHWRVTERNPTVRQSLPWAEAVGPVCSATARTAPPHHLANSGCHQSRPIAS